MLDDYDPAQLAKMVPEHLQNGLRLYIEQGVRSGDALLSIIQNERLYTVLARADDTTFTGLPSIWKFLHNYAPAACFGSTVKAVDWMVSGGLKGQGRI